MPLKGVGREAKGSYSATATTWACGAAPTRPSGRHRVVFTSSGWARRRTSCYNAPKRGTHAATPAGPFKPIYACAAPRTDSVVGATAPTHFGGQARQTSYGLSGQSETDLTSLTSPAAPKATVVCFDKRTRPSSGSRSGHPTGDDSSFVTGTPLAAHGAETTVYPTPVDEAHRVRAGKTTTGDEIYGPTRTHGLTESAGSMFAFGGHLNLVRRTRVYHRSGA